MTLDEHLPWHARLWESLARASQQNRMAHAFLLAGAAGLGKRRFAGQLAQAILCTAPAGPLQACGECLACRNVAAGTHPDCVRLGLSEGSKVIKVEDVRDFTRRLYLTNEQTQGKVSIIDPADALNTSAANALLKTIEEPPAGACVLLLANRPVRLPATLRSRCQLLRFTTPDTAVAAGWLKSHAAAATAELSQARGAPLLAMDMAEGGMAGRRHQWQADLEAVCSGKASPIIVAENWQKEDIPALITWMHGWLSDTAKLRLGMSSGELVNMALSSPMPAYVSSMTLSGFRTLSKALIETRRLLDSQASPQMLLENLLASWYQECRFARKSA